MNSVYPYFGLRTPRGALSRVGRRRSIAIAICATCLIVTTASASAFGLRLPVSPAVIAPPSITVDADTRDGADTAGAAVSSFFAGFGVEAPVPGESSVKDRLAGVVFEVVTTFRFPDGSTLLAAGLPGAAEIAPLPLGTSSVIVTATHIGNIRFFDTRVATVTVELGVDLPEVVRLPAGEDLDLPLGVYGFGTASSASLTLDGAVLDPSTTSITSALLADLGLPTSGSHTLTAEATDAGGGQHFVAVTFEIIVF